jgi:hydrocephalus-inducing protein
VRSRLISIFSHTAQEADICITFTPKAEQTYTRTLYCDVTGRETRLPLKLRGDGVGARVLLACDTLDLGTAIVGSEHTYEVCWP